MFCYHSSGLRVLALTLHTRMPEWYKGWHKETKDGPTNGRTLEAAIGSIATSVHRLDHPLRLEVRSTEMHLRIQCMVLLGILRNEMSLTFCPGNVGHSVGLMRIDGKIVKEAQAGQVVDIDISQSTCVAPMDPNGSVIGADTFHGQVGHTQNIQSKDGL